MNNPLEDLILKYKKHLFTGEKNLLEMTSNGKKDTWEYTLQKNYNKLWRIFLKDLLLAADKMKYENKKRPS